MFKSCFVLEKLYTLNRKQKTYITLVFLITVSPPLNDDNIGCSNIRLDQKEPINSRLETNYVRTLFNYHAGRRVRSLNNNSSNNSNTRTERAF